MSAKKLIEEAYKILGEYTLSSNHYSAGSVAAALLTSQGNVYTGINIDEDPDGREFVIEVNHGNRSVPTIVFPDGDILVEPSSSELLKKLEG